ncbi:MAG TPA: 50S ribosomal protein L11 methyltransferase [Desulfobacteraceae bacterium]|nr:50S ribosomal protein L11 methyltransferase [Desulfobacteraceae bacterium]
MADPSEKIVLDILAGAENYMAPGVVAKELSSRTGLSSRQARGVLRRLTDRGEIAYHYTFGATYLELSFAGSVKVTDHFTLKPFHAGAGKGTRDGEILLEQGISFGSGRHPTTRLSLAAMEVLFFQLQLLTPHKPIKAADIGTGSGVLAIAAIKAGASRCLALDTDPNAVSEAKHNVLHNRLSANIAVTGSPLERGQGPFDLICANLRVPTLKGLLPLFLDITSEASVLIISGIRTWETAHFVELFSRGGFKPVWRKDDKQWSGLILQKS